MHRTLLHIEHIGTIVPEYPPLYAFLLLLHLAWTTDTLNLQMIINAHTTYTYSSLYFFFSLFHSFIQSFFRSFLLSFSLFRTSLNTLSIPIISLHRQISSPRCDRSRAISPYSTSQLYVNIPIPYAYERKYLYLPMWWWSCSTFVHVIRHRRAADVMCQLNDDGDRRDTSLFFHFNQ